MHFYPLLVIVAGLLSTSRGEVVNTTETHNICNGSRYNNLNITAASSPFIIRSQEIGVDTYDNNMDCSLVLQSGTEPLVLSLEFREFNLEYNPIFGIDWLCVNGIQFSGRTFNGTRFNYILPGNRNFTVHFHTDGSITFPGFQMYVTTSPLADGETVDQPTGRGSDIHWITFVAATYYPGIPYSDGCAQNPPRATTTPPVYTDDNNEISTTTDEAATHSEEILFEETTDGTTNDTTIPASSPVIYNICDSSGPVRVNVGATSDPFFIRSPNYGSGGLYSNYLSCTLLLTSGDEPLVLSFYARDMNLEESFDTICVNGVRFSGRWFAGRTSSFILPERSTSTVLFLTDISVTYTGFDIKVTIRHADNQTVNQYVGFGSSPEGVAQVPTTYYPGMAYSDRCLLPPQSAADYGRSTTTDDTTTVETTIEESDDNTSTTIPVTYNICDSSGPVNVGATSDPFFIRSPNYGSGGLYSNYLSCTLLLTSGDEPLVLSFYASDFYVELNYDTLCVNGVRFTGSWFAGRTSSFILPERSTSTVRFLTDYSVTYTGFNIQVTIRCADNQTVNQYVGYGNSPESVAQVPTTYYPGMAYSDRCLLPPQPAGDYGLSTTTDDTTTVETTTEESDNNINTTSTSEYDSYYLGSDEQPTVYINTSSSPFFILSPNYGSGSHLDSQFYALAIGSGAQPLVLTMDIKDFQVEYQINCLYESMSVGGATFCGDWLTGYKLQYVLPEHSYFVISFITGYAFLQRGFKIKVSQELVTTGQIVHQPSNGIISSSSALTYTEETYRPGYPDSDTSASSSSMTPEYTSEFTTGFTEAPPPGVCYSAEVVRELNAALDQAIADLKRAKRLLNGRK